jgi:SpoIID/LytB domain protein
VATIQNNISEYSKEAPEFITVNGEKIPAKQALARLITAELSNGYRFEVSKAYTVAAYTCLKVIGNDFVLDNVRISEAANGVVTRAVEAVFGEYLTYNNFLAIPLFHNLTAVNTLDMSAKLPYLKSVKLERHQDVNVRYYQSSKVYSVDEMKAILLKNDNSVVLSENPAEWVVIKEHDASVSTDVGNVKSVVFNGTEMTGIEFKLKVMGDEKLPSICYQITYNAETSSFIVTTYGQDYGIGMGQIGAKYLETNENDYKAILSNYYEGTTVTKE